MSTFQFSAPLYIAFCPVSFRVKNLSEVVGLPSMPHVYMVMFSWKIGKGKEDEFSRSLDTIMRTWVPFMSQTINPTDSKFSINRPGMILVGNKVHTSYSRYETV